MKDSTIQEVFTNALKIKFPNKTQVINLLMDNLSLGKEAVYRRLRGEVSFSLEEVILVSKSLHLSLDQIFGISTPNSRPFQLKMTDFGNPSEADYLEMENFVEFLNNTREDKFTELGSSSNIMPQVIFFNYKQLTKFFVMRTNHQWYGLDGIKNLNDVTISFRMKDILKRYIEEMKYVKNTYYVLDNMFFYYLVNDIQHFFQVSYISKEDVLLLKEELLESIDNLELLAAKGHYETGNKIHFYLSKVNFESTYSYFLSDKYTLSLFKTFTLNAFTSFETETFEKLHKWIQSLKRFSTLISECGEVERINFFNKQRELVHSFLS
jgi:hypothetical protein